MLRFSYSPTVDIDIGNLRIAILSYMVAKQRGEQYIIRIDDREKERNIEGKDTELLQILEKFAISHDQVFHQSDNLHMHQTLAIRLLEEGRASACICTPHDMDGDDIEDYRCSGECQNIDREKLKSIKDDKIPFVIRIKRPSSPIVYSDLIRDDVVTSPDKIDDFIILRANGLSTHNFATACDDILRGVDFVICDEEHLDDIPRQIYIKELLGYDGKTTYATLPPMSVDIGDEEGYSSDSNSLVWMLGKGFTPDAIINHLVAISCDTPTEIFTLPEAMEWFKLESLYRYPVTFDMDELRFINSQHLNMMDDKRLSSLFGFADEDIGRLAKIYLSEASTISELESKIRPIFRPKEFSGEWGEQMRILASIISDLPLIYEFDKFQELLMRESGLKGDNFTKPLRILFTGADSGPELRDIYPHIKSYLLEIIS